MTDLFGATRSIVTDRYALFTPEGFVPSVLPGWENTDCVIIIAPQLGADFCQLMLTLHKDGRGQGDSEALESFVFVQTGEIDVQIGSEEKRLATGGFCYIPPAHPYQIQAASNVAQLVVFQRLYDELDGVAPPDPLFSHEDQVEALPFLGNEDARLKTLLPETPAFDMAVNIFTYQPGATLPMVETHIMEHGLVMLQGQGIYRLGNDWHPVQTGDVIWMAPYCPQWFVAMGKTPARYIYYKDVNREPL